MNSHIDVFTIIKNNQLDLLDKIDCYNQRYSIWDEYYDFNPLMYAVALRKYEIVKIILNKTFDINYATDNGLNTLMVSAAINDPILVEKLLKLGADINATTHNNLTVFHYAVEQRNKILIKLLLDFGMNTSLISDCLYLMRTDLDIEILEILLKNGCNADVIDHNGMTPLMHAIKNKQFKTSKILLRYTSNINQQVTNYDLSTDKYSALSFAVVMNNIDIILELIKNGADINVLDRDGNSLLILACKYNYGIDVLLENNINPNIQSGISPDESSEWTALHWASKHGNIKNVIALLNAKINKFARDSDGFSAYDIADNYGHKKIKKFLCIPANIGNLKIIK